MDGFSISDCKNNDGLGRIRTGDLRRVKTEDLSFISAFSGRSALFFGIAPVEITTGNASAPSRSVW
jgi:hypothetical protein